MRNFTVFESFAEDFNRYAPRAPILNYTNPLTPLTDVLVRMCDAPVVGLCHALFENLRYLNHIYGVAEDDMEVSYGGLNHFFWMTEIGAGDRDLLADLRARVASEGMTAILAECTEDSPVRDLATELFKRTGVMPYCGDRHTCEFYPLYITDREAMAAYHLPRTSIDDRRQQRERQRQELIAIEQGGELPEAYRRAAGRRPPTSSPRTSPMSRSSMSATCRIPVRSTICRAVCRWRPRSESMPAASLRCPSARFRTRS